MTRTQTIVAVSIAFAALLAGGLLWRMGTAPPPTHSVQLTFEAEVDGQPLELNRFSYANPGGSGTFQIQDFRFFLSQVQLFGDGTTHAPADSYHLMRFDNPKKTATVNLNSIPLTQVKKISFAIGVDDNANRSIKPRGDLDPNSRMAWNWEVGYKFVLLEGGLRVGDQVLPLVYHVGFSENLRTFSFELPQPLALDANPPLRFRVDIMKLFNGKTVVDMAHLKSVKFDKQDARMLADNYQSMIELIR